MATRLFSTDGLTGDASARAWRRFLGEIYYDLDVAPVEATVKASMHETALREMRLSRVRANAMNVMRQAPTTRSTTSCCCRSAARSSIASGAEKARSPPAARY